MTEIEKVLLTSLIMGVFIEARSDVADFFTDRSDSLTEFKDMQSVKDVKMFIDGLK